jgi:hypothetical protein
MGYNCTNNHAQQEQSSHPHAHQRIIAGETSNATTIVTVLNSHNGFQTAYNQSNRLEQPASRGKLLTHERLLTMSVFHFQRDFPPGWDFYVPVISGLVELA